MSPLLHLQSTEEFICYTLKWTELIFFFASLCQIEFFVEFDEIFLYD
jgi:hypothetical protein